MLSFKNDRTYFQEMYGWSVGDQQMNICLYNF